MSKFSKLAGRVLMDPAAFAKFCETSSIALCVPSGGETGRSRTALTRLITIDADADRIMLEAEQLTMRDLRLVADLQKAAQAGQVDGAFMIACYDGCAALEAIVFRDSETWIGQGDCINSPVTVGSSTTRRIAFRGTHIDTAQQVDSLDTVYRVSRDVPLLACNCGGYDDRTSEHLCRNDGKLVADDNIPVVDIATLMPPRATGHLEQALLVAAGAVNAYGQLAVGRLAWDATGPDTQHLFRSWLETFEEGTGSRSVMWLPDLFHKTSHSVNSWVVENTNFRPVGANTTRTQGGACPVFLVLPSRPDTIQIAAHVDYASLADAAKLVVDGADPADAVAIIAAITDPDRA